MTTDSRHDAVIAAWLEAGPTSLTVADRDAIADQAELVRQRRGTLVPWALGGSRRLRLALVAAALGTAIIAGALLNAGVNRRPPTPLVWTGDGINEPFPAPLRAEPWFGAAPLVQPALAPPDEGVDASDRTWVFADPLGDAAPAPLAVSDLRTLEFRTWGCWHPDSLCIWFDTASHLARPFVDPRTDWVAYGAVFDNDGDGRADVRWGLDNQPGDSVRSWREDLRTGDVVQRTGIWPDINPLWEVEYPHIAEDGLAHPGYGMLHTDLTTPKGHFYLWSAVIRNGQIVAMDFAPDAGWLDGRPDDDESQWRATP